MVYQCHVCFCLKTSECVQKLCSATLNKEFTLPYLKAFRCNIAFFKICQERVLHSIVKDNHYFYHFVTCNNIIDFKNYSEKVLLATSRLFT